MSKKFDKYIKKVREQWFDDFNEELSRLDEALNTAYGRINEVQGQRRDMCEQIHKLDSDIQYHKKELDKIKKDLNTSSEKDAYSHTSTIDSHGVKIDGLTCKQAKQINDLVNAVKWHMKELYSF